MNIMLTSLVIMLLALKMFCFLVIKNYSVKLIIVIPSNLLLSNVKEMSNRYLQPSLAFTFYEKMTQKLKIVKVNLSG